MSYVGRALCSVVSVVVFATYLFCQAAPAPSIKPDYSKEGFVVEQWLNKIVFENDGTSTRTVQVRVRMQSESGVQRFGLLAFAYQGSVETLDFDYIRVHKADGTVVVTPPENIQDQPSEVSLSAPLYSDIRQKHVAVKGLGSGDTLEYECHWKLNSPLAQGQFWYDYSFENDVVVLDEQLEVRVPRERKIKLKSDKLQPQVSEAGNYRVYLWKTSNSQSKPEASADEKQDKLWQLARGRLDQPDVRLSSFQDWADVGRWYGDLQKDRIKPNAAIQAKAAELTKTSRTDDEKLHAIYHYVSTKFRYIGIDFGIGRYQPHQAAEVLDNQYGDCKDKHTLLTALLAASGIQAEPALISSTREIDPDVPSPSQFDHVITAVPRGKELIWLDSTIEVAPFAHLAPSLREKHALLIPADKPATLEVTSANPPFGDSVHFKAEGKLSEEGVFDAQMERNVRGDVELLMRAAFRRTPPSQWKDLMQNISYATGFAGTVSDVEVTQPEDTENTFAIKYKYNRKDYSDWKDKQITPPFLAINLLRFKDDDKKPKNPIWLGAPGEIVMDAKIELPHGYKATLPATLDIDREFAYYRSHYEAKDGVLIAQRRFVIKQQEVKPSQFESYKSFEKAISDDEDNYTVLTSEKDRQSGETQQQARTTLQQEFWKLPNSSNSEAQRLEEQGRMVWQQRNLNEALRLLQQSVAADPKFARAWVAIAELQMWNGHQSEGLEAYRKAIAAEPKQPYPYKALGFALMGLRKFDEAIPVWRDLAKNVPDDQVASLNLGTALLSTKQYSEALDALEKAAHQNEKSAQLQISLAEAYSHNNNKDKASAAYAKALEIDSSALMLNNVAYSMAEMDINLDDALQYAQKAVKEVEETSQKIELSSLKNDDLFVPGQLAAYWDTLGWVYFRRSQMDLAEKTLRASWQLSFSSTIGEHLGQVYEKQQKRQAAIHIYQLALSTMLPFAHPEDSEAFKRMQKLGATPERNTPNFVGGEEISKMRTIKLPRLMSAQGSAEYYVLLSPGGKVEATKFLNGSDKLKSVDATLKTAKFDVPFPEGSQGRLLRRGILSCYPYSGCSFVFMPLESVRSVD